MSWISQASRKLWQAYCQGLEMSCPVQRLDHGKQCARDGSPDAEHDDGRTSSNQSKGPTIH